MERDISALTQDFSTISPEKTLIVGFDSHFLGYRHAGYYLPAFVTAQYPEVRYGDGMRVFLMHGRDTRVVRSFSVGRFDRFIFFPLPDGSEYGAYLESVLAKLPPGTIQTAQVGRRKVLTGPASAIPLLFPSTTRATALSREGF